MKRFRAFLLFLTVALCFPAYSGVVMLGTRVIYPAESNFVQVKFNNNDANSYLMQVWVDDGRGSPQIEIEKAPFIVTPHIYRIKGNSQQTVRVVFSKSTSLPNDRESQFWFNFLQIPPENDRIESQSSSINLAFLTQVKLIYRPQQIKSDIKTLGQDLTFALTRAGNGWRLSATNPTGYYATFVNKASVQSTGRNSVVNLGDNLTLAPFSTIAWNVKLDNAALKNPQLDFSLINDRGTPVGYSSSIKIQ